jgi:3-deoxy-D-manno-octulosonic-acid transferase
MRDQLAQDGWAVGLRSEGDEPSDDLSVYIADLPGELGLWLRLAPISFMGGTLTGAPSSRSPMEAAVLGSAILHGPLTGDHAADYRRLDAAGAARVATRPADIAAAVEALSAPDQAAAMAHAAWEISSAGEDAIARTLAALEAALAGRA